MAEFRGGGQSLYRGLRTTVTLHPTRGLLLATTSVKKASGGWDDWTALAPVARLEMDHPPETLEAALWVLHDCTYLAWLDAVNPPL